ncbi:hypothetical protein PVAG01_11397 [Phlyctema vagabunda]|uniref:Uncharacterized protein n=1 Tax=Phlyctema vagabunda TaxID=108571 RepID=A0ABR4P2I9_9HELO
MVCISFDFGWFWVRTRTWKTGEFKAKQAILESKEKDLESLEKSIKIQMQVLKDRARTLDDNIDFQLSFQSVLEKQSTELDGIYSEMEAGATDGIHSEMEVRDSAQLETPASSVIGCDEPGDSIVPEGMCRKRLHKTDIDRISVVLQSIPYKSALFLLLQVCAARPCKIHEDTSCLCWIERIRRRRVYELQRERGVIVTDDSNVVILREHPPTFEFGTVWVWDNELREAGIKNNLLSKQGAEDAANREKLKTFYLYPELCFEIIFDSLINLPVYSSSQEFWEDFEKKYWSWTRVNMQNGLEERNEKIEQLRLRIRGQL